MSNEPKSILLEYDEFRWLWYTLELHMKENRTYEDFIHCWDMLAEGTITTTSRYTFNKNAETEETQKEFKRTIEEFLTKYTQNKIKIKTIKPDTKRDTFKINLSLSINPKEIKKIQTHIFKLLKSEGHYDI